MGKDLDINNKIQTYIQNLSKPLHPIQKEIIAYNETLGDIKRMQISVSQCHFLHLMIKTCNAKNILEIGTFTGLSTLSMSLALSDEGSIIALDKNLETNKIALDFFNKANQGKKIKTIVYRDYSLNSSYFVFQILSEKRSKIIQLFKHRKIGFSIHYPNILPDMTYYKKKYKLKFKHYRNARTYGKNCISLPAYPLLKDKEINLITKTIEEALK